MKVGLITIYHVPNYGSVLQAYATQCILEKMGHECVMINYKYPNEWHISQDSRRKQGLIKKIVYLFGIKPAHRKRNRLEKFKEKYFHFSKKSYATLDAMMAENWNDFSAFVVGSDQVWNYRYTLGDSAFMLSFVPDNKFKMSLSSSIASKQLPEATKNKYVKYLNRVDKISVREEQGRDVINNELGINKDVTVVLDPTLLLTQEEWMHLLSISTISNKVKEDKYILLYMLTYAFEPRPYVFELINYYQKELGYKIIALEGYTPPQNANGIVMVDCTSAGIENFIQLFSGAEMVITTSFHGTAFAVNFGIPFISIVPNGNNGDERQKALLKSLELQKCMAPVGMSFDEINPYYDKVKAKKKLEDLRKASLSWISDALLNA